jgi:cytochrome c peroxidase
MRQHRQRQRFLGLLGLLVLAGGCQPAHRYVTAKSAVTPEPAKAAAGVPPDVIWLPPEAQGQDIPIVFVDAASRPKEWEQLPEFWNHFPPPPCGTPTAHLGMTSPLSAATALLVMDELNTVQIKVPLGLPDPAPWIPKANPPTYGKWRLGKRLFFDRELLPLHDGGACATCHQPEHGFTVAAALASAPQVDPPGLLNAVYNRHQLWDGRAATLEEVVFHDLTQPAGADGPWRHAWEGLVPRLHQSQGYRAQFQAVFGIRQPTEDAVAKALATYLRTLLSGDSLFDRAWRQAGQRADKVLKAEDFEAFLDDTALEKLGKKTAKKADVGRMLLTGFQLFHGEAGCVRCHSGWAFTDGDFHNLGVRESGWLKSQLPGKEAGRFRQVPIGLKEARLIGAFRTPTLRNLPQTGPYFHDGQKATLEGVVLYYSRDLQMNDHLDPLLLAGPRTVRPLDLHNDDVRALATFLRALDGDPVPAVIARP